MLPSNLEGELLRPGEVTVLAGPPGQGKTSLALQLALSTVKKKKSAAVFSLKTAKARLMKRLLCLEASIPLTAAMSDDISPADQRKAASASKLLSRSPLHIFDSAASIKEIERMSRRLAGNGSRPRLGLIVIDYLQLVSEVLDDGATHNASAVTRSLKALARDLDVPVLLMSLARSRADALGILDRDVKRVLLTVTRSDRRKKILMKFDKSTGRLSKP